jgi:hypothetical protein
MIYSLLKCHMNNQSVYTLAQHDTRMYEFVNKGKSFPYQCSDEKKIGIEKNRSNFILILIFLNQ